MGRTERTTFGGTAASGIGSYTSSYVETASGSLMEAGRFGFRAHIVANGAEGDEANNNAAAFVVDVERQNWDGMIPVLAAYATGGDRFLCRDGVENVSPTNWDCFGMTIGSANAVNLNFDGTSRFSFDYSYGSAQATIMAVNIADDLLLKTLGSQPISFDTANNGTDLQIDSSGNTIAYGDLTVGGGELYLTP
ncbi:hypothetical protein GTO10_06135, partial [Candidatus Saccharibacteria bacterium]|nr:hypothetical protein [Candidatus Saccharibacteria bacterium]